MTENIKEYYDLLEEARRRNLILHGRKISSFGYTEKKIRIDDVINEREKIKNEGLALNNELKKKTLSFLCNLLFGETLIVFVFSFFQAFGLWGFKLEEWSFKLLITATISQITIMLLVAVKHLFPNQK